MSGRKRVGILVFDRVKALDFIGPAEVFTEANQRVDGYETLFFSPDGNDVTTSMGLRVGVDGPAAGDDPLDLIIIPGSEYAPAVYDDPAVSDAILALAARATKVASICSGAFALARTGLLDGKTATTHWKFTDALADTYPAVNVRPDSIFVRDGDVYSSAGVAAGIDLALAIVEDDFGADVARSVAQLLLVYMRRSGGQSQFSASVRVSPPRTSVARAVADYVASDPARPTSLRDLAAHANVSIRHLNRVIRDELGMTPIEYAGSMRLDLALGLLEEGRAVSETASVAGYPSTVAFRRAFAARYGTTPSDYQKRFQTTGDGIAEPPKI
ncbi:GlxA family transcriptional regulator [Microbacterium hatanonis]|jgi:transcriptional regulator GlxA family with amidase domain|uniref:Helix-turn-helix domain-containing protein n=1 Tax=Microbacterium hatanonis TaxID=404366 RepID=A0A5C8I298_9MICO|nr:DJ-1/PfpI family protein [Microbacterium hatanonis]TXK12200.1 helix-turn-helix domain-containing protein [Microbacterium hatanonis]